MPDRELIETQRALVSNWGMLPSPVAEDDLNRRLLLEALVERIVYLFKYDYNKLLTALYMLDVPEPRYRAALAHTGVEAKAMALAELILERETARVRSWLHYAAQRHRAGTPAALEDAPHQEDPGPDGSVK